MERHREIKDTNHDLKVSLFLWQRDPDSVVVQQNIGNLFLEATKKRFGMEIRIHDSIMENSEGRRAILKRDLDKYARHEGNFYVFGFVPSKEMWHGNSIVRLTKSNNNPVLQILNNEWGEFSQEAVFFPHEVASIVVTKKK